MRDATSLPTSILSEHENKYAHLTRQEEEDEIFPFKYVLGDDDIEPYMGRWVLDRWDDYPATEPSSESLHSRSRPSARRGKRPRQGFIEQRSLTNEQHHSTTTQEKQTRDQSDKEIREDISESDEDFVIDTEEAIEVQYSLRAFTAAQMMP